MIQAIRGAGSTSSSGPSREEMIASIRDAQPKKGFLDKVQEFGEKVDSYTGAPSRSAVMSMLNGDFKGAPGAFSDNFGGDSKKAPTAKDIALKVGVNDNPAELEKASGEFSVKGIGLKTLLGLVPGGGALAPSVGKALDERGVTNADIAAVPIDFATDWTNLLGAVPVMKGVKAVKKALGLSDLVKDTAKGLEFAVEGGKLIRKGGNAVKAVEAATDAVKVGESVGDAVKVADGLPPTQVMELAYEGGRKVDPAKVKEAANILGFEPTPGMLDAGPTLRGLESSLDQSPSIGGYTVRSGKTGTNQLRSGLNKAVGRFGDEASNLSKFDAGEYAKADILEKTKEISDPIVKSFDEIASETKLIPVSDKAKELAAKRFMRQRDVSLAPDSPWGQIASRYANNIQNVKNVDDIKRIRSLSLKELRASTDDNVRSTLGYIAGQLEAMEGATIKNAARIAGPNPIEGVKEGGKLVKKLRDTRKGFRNVIEPLREVAENSGLRKPRTIKEFVEDISNIPSEQIADKMFKPKNVKAMNSLKTQFPSTWDSIRRVKISDIIKSSSQNGEIVPSKLVKNLKAMGPEIRQLMFDSPDINKNIDALETVLNSLPNKIGPSGTPQGEMFMNLARPAFQTQEGLRAGLYKQLQNPKIPIDAVKKAQTLKFPMKKAGQATVGGLADLLEQIQLGTFKVNAGRTIDNAIKDKK
tara:strand:- start:12109 stop:14202 length:2094 start_codon:yes stop_codon:yes gene_type:complete